MTPADLKVRREALGVSQGFVEDRMRVERRQVRRWESGESPVPDDVERLIGMLERFTDWWVDDQRIVLERMSRQFGRDRDGNAFPIPVDVYTDDERMWEALASDACVEMRGDLYDEYSFESAKGFEVNLDDLPASWHRMAMRQAARQLALDGVEVRFEYASTTL